jgi:hypothetical protein
MLDILFPLMEAVIMDVKIPAIVLLLCELIGLVQLAMVSWWPSSYAWPKEDDVFIWVYRLHSFGEYEPTPGYFMAFTCIVCGIVGLMLAVVVFELVYWHFRCGFMRWSLYLVKFLIVVVPCLALMPLAHLVGILLFYSWEGSTAHMCYLIPAVPLLIVSCVILYVGRIMFYSSLYLSSSPWATYDPHNQCVMWLAGAVASAVSGLCGQFPPAAHIPVMLLHACVSVYCLRGVLGKCYLFLAGAVFTAGVLGQGVILDVVLCLPSVIAQFRDPIITSGWVMLLICSVAAAIAFPAAAFYLRRDGRKIKCDLAYDGAINRRDVEDPIERSMSDDEKFERFRDLGIGKDARRARGYLLVGLRDGCDMFLDWSLLRFVLQHHEKPDMLAYCLRFVAYFPGEYRQTNAIAQQLNRMRDLPFDIVMVVREWEGIKTIRQSTGGPAAKAALYSMKQDLAGLIGLHHDMWRSSHNYYPQFLELGIATAASWARCEEKVHSFPNSLSHADAFVKVMIEGATDFVEAMKERHRMDLLEAGHTTAIDRCFRGMLRRWPFYLKDGLVTEKGVLVGVHGRAGDGASQAGGSQMGSGGGGGSGSGSLSEFGGSSDSENTGGLDREVEESVGHALITSWRTRVAVQHCLGERQLDCSTTVTVLEWLALIITCVAAVGLFILSVESSTITTGGDLRRVRRRAGK